MEIIEVEKVVFLGWQILGSAGLGYFAGVFSGVTLAIRVAKYFK